MMTKRMLSLTAAVLAALMLCACAAGTARADGDVPSFGDMEYTRPDPAALEACVISAEDALDAGEATEDVTALLDECYAEYYSFSTMYTLAEIRYMQDMSDEYYAQEYAWCAENYAAVQQLMERLYISCASSDAARELEEQYFWEGFTGEYGGEDASRYSDEAVELMQRENELVSEYYALTNAPQIELDGETVDYGEYTAQAEGYDYSRAAMEYYRQYNARFAGIYIELVKVRRALAEEMGYESYEQMQYESFERDYGPQEAADYLAGIKAEIVPLYEAVMAQEPYSAFEYVYMTEERLMDTVGAAAADIGGDAAEAFEFMRSHGLYDAAQSGSKASMSFTTYLDNYDAPFLFIDPYCDTEDVTTLSHEFGHYLDAYVNYNAYESLDLSECFSQAMEYIMLDRCAMQDGDEQAALRLIKLLDTLDLYVTQASFAEFESRVYAMNEDELDADALNMLSLELAGEYGYLGANEEYYALSWIDVTHFFEAPFYVISYPVANDAAMQIYALERENAGAGLEKYTEMLPRDHSGLIETLEAAGLESPFAPGRIEAAAALMREELAQAGFTVDGEYTEHAA